LLVRSALCLFVVLSMAAILPQEAKAYTETEAAIDATFPADVAPTFKMIAYRESGYDPYAINPYSGACGPFQFLPSTAAAYGYTCYDLQDPYIAAQAAYELYLDYGLSPWALTAY
jgi:hypothetical protein